MKKMLLITTLLFVPAILQAGRDKNTTDRNSIANDKTNKPYGTYGKYERTLVKCENCTYEWTPPKYKDNDTYLCPKCLHWKGKEVTH